MDPISSASVIVLRGGEVYLVRRHARSSFMRLAFVFPGGGADGRDGGLEQTAIRELFEEAGVLISDESPSSPELHAIRAELASGQSFGEVLRRHQLHASPSKLRFWARWVTPSVEPRRFDATFFVAELPEGQEPSIDGREVIDARWMSPREALDAHEAGVLTLPPPQIRMLFELDAALAGGDRAWEATAKARNDRGARLMPRLAQVGAEQRPALLLPWDPVYEAQGTGEMATLPVGHPWAWGPSRFEQEGGVWRLRFAP